MIWRQVISDWMDSSIVGRSSIRVSRVSSLLRQAKYRVRISSDVRERLRIMSARVCSGFFEYF